MHRGLLVLQVFGQSCELRHKRKSDFTSLDNLNVAVKEVLDENKKCHAVAKTRSLRRHPREMILTDTTESESELILLFCKECA